MPETTQRDARRSAKPSVEGDAAKSGPTEGAAKDDAEGHALAVIEASPDQLGLIDMASGTVLSLPNTDLLPSVEKAYLLIEPLKAAIASGRKYLSAITALALQDLVERGGSERRVAGILFKRESDTEWSVDDAIMRSALEALVPAELSGQEVEEAVTKTVSVTYKGQNVVLNKLAKRGGIVAETIARHRRRVEGASRIVRMR